MSAKVTKDTKGTKDGSPPGPNEISYRVIGCALRVHTAIGPGVLEKAVAACLHHEMVECGLRVESQVPLPLVYRSVRLPLGYRVDFIVEGCLVLEIKCVSKILEVHRAQLLNYLRQSHLPLGLLLNFGEAHMKDGIHRVINGRECDL
jgi:GxxExxY protein